MVNVFWVKTKRTISSSIASISQHGQDEEIKEPAIDAEDVCALRPQIAPGIPCWADIPQDSWRQPRCKSKCVLILEPSFHCKDTKHIVLTPTCENKRSWNCLYLHKKVLVWMKGNFIKPCSTDRHLWNSTFFCWKEAYSSITQHEQKLI